MKKSWTSFAIAALMCTVGSTSTVLAATENPAASEPVGAKYSWKTITEAKWSEIQPVGNYFRVQLNGKYGLIDRKGTFIFQNKYQEIVQVGENKFLARVNQNGKSSFVDQNGRTVFTLPASWIIKPFLNGQAVVYRNGAISSDFKPLFPLAGVINEQGKYAVPTKYASISPLIDNKIYIGDKYLTDDGKSAKGIIDKNGNTLLPFKYDDIIMDHYDPNFIITSKNQKQGVVNTSGKTLIPFEYDEFIGEAYTRSGDDSLRYFPNGHSIAKKKGKYGVIDKQGKVLIPFTYDFIQKMYNTTFKNDEYVHEGNNLLLLKSHNKYGIATVSGTLLGTLQWDTVDDFNSGLAAVYQNNKYGFIDQTGKLVVPVKYDVDKKLSTIFVDGVRAVKQNGKYGYLSSSGKEISSPQWDTVADRFTYGLGLVSKNGKYGFIDKTGQVVIPLEFDGASSFNAGFARVNQGEGWFFIDTQGNTVLTRDKVQEEFAKNDQDLSDLMIDNFDVSGVSTVLPRELNFKGNYYLINKEGKLLTPKGYAFLHIYDNGTIIAYDGPYKIGVGQFGLSDRVADMDSPEGTFELLDKNGSLILSYPKELEKARYLNKQDFLFDTKGQLPNEYYGITQNKDGKFGVIKVFRN